MLSIAWKIGESVSHEIVIWFADGLQLVVKRYLCLSCFFTKTRTAFHDPESFIERKKVYDCRLAADKLTVTLGLLVSVVFSWVFLSLHLYTLFASSTARKLKGRSYVFGADNYCLSRNLLQVCPTDSSITAKILTKITLIVSNLLNKYFLILKLGPIFLSLLPLLFAVYTSIFQFYSYSAM